MPISVSQVNNYLKSLVDNDMVLSTLDVQGEVSNFKEYSASGQWYFTLKDADSQISCVVFAGVAAKLKYQPVDGDRLVVKGKLAVFNKRGTYNLQIFWLSQDGVGGLAQDFEKLKQKLLAEGLFEASRKKALPKYPCKIAILAAREGAAVHDVIRVATRRNPGIQLVVVPTIVQGQAAIQSIVQNIQRIEALGNIDVLILARGGGSLEDLWAFNTEEVARAIAACRIPTVSAIGHEVDFTIADFVADLRAATPSVAAELVVPELAQILTDLQEKQQDLKRGLRYLIEDQYQQLAYAQERMQTSLARRFERTRATVGQYIARLEALNPLTVLSRGYGIVENNNKVVRSIKDITVGDHVRISLADGTMQAEVQAI